MPSVISRTSSLYHPKNDSALLGTTVNNGGHDIMRLKKDGYEFLMPCEDNEVHPSTSILLEKNA